MSNTLRGRMPTDRAQRYAKQLVSHWSARGPVTEDESGLLQQWETGQQLRLHPTPAALEIEVTVPDGADVVQFGGVVARHLERFGQRDELHVEWDEPLDQ